MIPSARQRRKQQQENADIITGDFVSTEKAVDSIIPQLFAIHIWKKEFAGKSPVPNDILKSVDIGLEVQKGAVETTDVNIYMLNQENMIAENRLPKIKCLTVMTVNMKKVVEMIGKRMLKHHTQTKGLTIVTHAIFPRITEMTYRGIEMQSTL